MKPKPKPVAVAGSLLKNGKCQALYRNGIGVRRGPVYPGYRTGGAVPYGGYREYTETKDCVWNGRRITFYKLADGSGWIHNYDPDTGRCDRVKVVTAPQYHHQHATGSPMSVDKAKQAENENLRKQLAALNKQAEEFKKQEAKIREAERKNALMQQNLAKVKTEKERKAREAANIRSNIENEKLRQELAQLKAAQELQALEAKSLELEVNKNKDSEVEIERLKAQLEKEKLQKELDHLKHVKQMEAEEQRHKELEKKTFTERREDR
eukprot:UN25131